MKKKPGNCSVFCVLFNVVVAVLYAFKSFSRVDVRAGARCSFIAHQKIDLCKFLT